MNVGTEAPEAFPAFAPGVRVVEHVVRGRRSYLVEDPRTAAVFELGEMEYFLCQQLDGRAGPAEVLEQYAERFGQALDPKELRGFLRQLARQGLLDGFAPGRAPRRTVFELLDPEKFFVVARRPLANGNRLLGWLARHTGWLFSRPAKVLGCALIALGWGTFALRWAALHEALRVQWGTSFLLLLIAVACLLVRSPRSLVHGLMCKRYSGQVPEIGLAFIYYVLPSVYCDWSSFGWIRDPTKRFWTIAAGLVVQLLIGAIAVLGWSLTLDGSTANVFWLATVTAVFLNLIFLSANPFVPMEGYLLLANRLEVGALRERALAAFGAWMMRDDPPEAFARGSRRWFTLYGGLCFTYGTGLLALHFYWAWSWFTRNFAGSGVLLTAALGMLIFHKPMASYARDREPVRWFLDRDAGARRWIAWAGLALLVALAAWCPYPYETGGPLRLLPARQTEVRADVEGLIERVMVHEGDMVAAEQPLAVIDQREYEHGLQAKREELTSREADLKLLQAGPRPEEVARASQEVAQAEQEVQRSQQEVEEAQVRLRYGTARATRYANLFADDVVSRQDYDNAVRERDMARESLDVAVQGRKVTERGLEVARAGYDLAKSGARAEQIESVEAEVRRLRVLVKDLERQVDETVLRSPVAGRLVTPYVEQRAGQYLKKGDLFAVVEESGPVQAELQVPEEDAGEVREGSRLKVVVWAYPDETFIGTVRLVAPLATSDTDTRQLRVVRVLTEIPNPDGVLKSALTGYGKIAAGSRPLWRVFLWPVIRWFKVQFWYWLP